MAWLQKQGDIWWIGWRHDGKQFRKSTGTEKREVAEKELQRLKTLEAARKVGALSDDFVAAVTGKRSEKTPAASFLARWLADSKGNTTHTTHVKYQQVAREFLASIRAEETGILIEDVTVDHVSAFLAQKRLKSSPGTVKGFKRILGSVFLQAQNEGKIKGNPVALSARTSRGAGKENEKRPFTLAEIKDLHARGTPFWQYMILAGFYLGQSMGDLVTLKRENVDLAENVVRISRRKTKKRVIIPIAKPLRALLERLWPARNGDFFWPEEAARYLATGSSSFSQEFYELMCAAGMVPARKAKHIAKGKGRAAKRESFSLGFHNLRHTFITQLKMSGAVDSIAKELAGHSSSAINTHYTHLPVATLANAVNQLPEVLK